MERPVNVTEQIQAASIIIDLVKSFLSNRLDAVSFWQDGEDTLIEFTLSDDRIGMFRLSLTKIVLDVETHGVTRKRSTRYEDFQDVTQWLEALSND